MEGQTFDEKLRLTIEVLGAEHLENQLAKLQVITGKAAKPIKKELSSYGITRDKIPLLEQELGIRKEIESENEKFVQDLNRRTIVEDNIAKNKQKQNEAQLKNVRRFKAEYLSIMFAGMQLQRTFGGLFKDLISSYKELTKESVTPLSASLIRLEANWKFLKFAMLDAASPLIQTIADAFANIAYWIAKQDPTTLTLLTGLIGTLALLGTAAFAFGQGALLFTSMASAASYSTATYTAMDGTISKLTLVKSKDMTAGAKFLKSLGDVAAMGAITISIKEAFDSASKLSQGDYVGSWIDGLEAAVGMTGGLLWLGGNKAAGGAMFAVLIGMELLESNKLFKSFFSIFGVIAGIGTMAGVVFQQSFQRAFTKGMRSFIPEDSPLAVLTGINKIYDAEDKKMMDELSDAFAEGFKGWYDTGVEADEMLKILTDNAKKDINEYVDTELLAKQNLVEIDEITFKDKKQKITFDIYENWHQTGKSTSSKTSSAANTYKAEWEKRLTDTLEHQKSVNSAVPT